MAEQNPDEVLAGLDFDLTDALAEGPVDMTATLTRRFAWDTMDCPLVPDLLTALGLTLGSEEGQDVDHRESHQRMHAVLPLEGQVQAYSHVLGVVLTKAMAVAQGVELCEEHEEGFAGQNTEVIKAAVRAVLAQLMFSGIIQYGPMAAMATSVQIVDVNPDLGEDTGE